MSTRDGVAVAVAGEAIESEFEVKVMYALVSSLTPRLIESAPYISLTSGERRHQQDACIGN